MPTQFGRAAPPHKSAKDRAVGANSGGDDTRITPAAPMRNAAGLRQTHAAPRDSQAPSGRRPRAHTLQLLEFRHRAMRSVGPAFVAVSAGGYAYFLAPARESSPAPSPRCLLHSKPTSAGREVLTCPGPNEDSLAGLARALERRQSAKVSHVGRGFTGRMTARGPLGDTFSARRRITGPWQSPCRSGA